MSSKSTTSLLLLTLSICCILPVGLFAQVLNGGINYRADVRQVTGQPAFNGPYQDNETIFKPHIDEDGLATYIKINDAQVTCYRYGFRTGVNTPPLAQQTLPIIEVFDIPVTQRYDASAWAFGKHLLNATSCLYQVNPNQNVVSFDRYDVEKGIL